MRRHTRSIVVAVGICVCALALAGCRCNRKAPTTAPAAGSDAPAKPTQWRSLFDGKSLGQWAPSDFGGDTLPMVRDGMLILPPGNDLTGVTWTGPLPRMNYEIELEAQRVSGSDFFCGLTFPVNDSCASLILGGWGGSLCGISCLDGRDASQNETTCTRQFENGRWYLVRLRVTPHRIQAWLDEEELIDAVITNRAISVRWEVIPSQPLGIATWQTAGAVRFIRMRELTEEEIEAARPRDL